MIWLIIIAIIIYFICQNINGNELDEGFVSGEEKLIATYDQIYPLDHPKYVTPQQKDFQIVLSEHSALDPNLQNRRKDIRTQHCALGGHCFSTSEWHALNYPNKSSPDIINSQMGFGPKPPRSILYTRHQTEKVVPHNSVAKEMRADLFDEIILPDLFFRQRRVINKGEPKPEERQTQTEIF